MAFPKIDWREPVNNPEVGGKDWALASPGASHWDLAMILSQVILAVEPAWQRCGTGKSMACSHYDYDDLISSKI
jgi:hypothetical protein